MIGEQSIMSRSPSFPTSTGKLPIFSHWLTASRRSAGGSSNEMNSRPVTLRMLCADSREVSSTDSRSGESAGIELVFTTSIESFRTSSRIAVVVTETAPHTSSFPDPGKLNGYENTWGAPFSPFFGEGGAVDSTLTGPAPAKPGLQRGTQVSSSGRSKLTE